MLKPIRVWFLFAGISLGFAALAQSVPDESIPPARVARLSYIDGAVSFVPAGENDWVEADLNRPLIGGDRLWTDRDSRAVLELGDASIRMDQRTSFDFLDLDDHNAQIELTQGTLNLRVRRLYDGQSYEIDTPTLAFVVNRVGEFRIDVAPDGDSTIVTVRNGGGDVYGEDEARFQVEEGQSVVFHDPRLTDYVVNDLPAPDNFDDFCYQRDRRWDDSPSRRFVSEEIIGYQDLDQYGDWQSVPDYGFVWYPTTVAAGWAPYRHGHWVWVGLYGWTWVDDAPWGFAPFHYGRWAFIRGRWGWCPGPRTSRPVYAPALVAFVGGVGVSISSGPIGWFPLGVGDVYYPSYRVNRGYFTRLNEFGRHNRRDRLDKDYRRYLRGNVDYANIRYTNRHIRNALTAVPARAFVDARPVAKAAIRVNNATFANARVHGFARLAPTRESLVRARKSRARSLPTMSKRHIVAATRPPVPIAAFSAHRARLQKNPGRPLGIRQLRNADSQTGKARHGAKHGVNRPNLRVVTKQGTPPRTAAPVLPKRTSDVARKRLRASPHDRGNPVRDRGKRRPVPAVTPIERNRPTRENPRALESSRFARPSQNSRAKEHRPVPAQRPPRNNARKENKPERPKAKIRREQNQQHGQRATLPRGNAAPRVEQVQRKPAQRPQPRRVEPQNRANHPPRQQTVEHKPPAQRPQSRRLEPQIRARPTPSVQRIERRPPVRPQYQRPQRQMERRAAPPRVMPQPARAQHPPRQQGRHVPPKHEKKSDNNDGNGHRH